MPKRRKGLCYGTVCLAGDDLRFSVELETPSASGKEGAFIRIVCKDEAGADAVRDAILEHSTSFVEDVLEAKNA